MFAFVAFSLFVQNMEAAPNKSTARASLRFACRQASMSGAGSREGSIR
jgi:hypothetical protein